MPSGNLFIVSAPSGGGKTSLTQALLKRLAERGFDATLSVSYTTRAPRVGEQDGVHYHFVDDATFASMVDAGEFLEHARVFDRSYGTGRARTQALLDAGQDVFLDIDWQGGRQVRSLAPEVTSIFILPPSVAALEQRLRSRSQDDEATIARRMSAAREEMSHYAEYDYLIVNDRFEHALDELYAVVVASRLKLSSQKHRVGDLIGELVANGAALR